MHNTWLIVNSHSGSFDADACEQLPRALDAAGYQCARVINCPEDGLPDRAAVEAAGVDTVAVFTGDGTINSVHAKLSGWGGRVLVLPGGTLNLLAKKLHGDRLASDIVADLANVRTIRPEVIEGGDIAALVGVIVGPTTAWGAVRETMRHLDLGGLVEAVPHAWDETFGDGGVRMAGDERVFPALNLTPSDGGIFVQGFLADHAAHVLGHGFAWLGGDFRTGPHEELGRHAAVTIEGEGEIGMLYDGEPGTVPAGTRCTLGHAAVDFLATLPA